MSSDHIDRVAGEPWFILGEHPDGYVDVSDGTDDVFERIPRAKAERLIKLRADFLNAVRAEYESRAEYCFGRRRGPDALDKETIDMGAEIFLELEAAGSSELAEKVAAFFGIDTSNPRGDR